MNLNASRVKVRRGQALRARGRRTGGRTPRLTPRRTAPSRPVPPAGSSAGTRPAASSDRRGAPGRGRSASDSVWSSFGSSSSRYSATSGCRRTVSWRSRCSWPARLSARSRRRATTSGVKTRPVPAQVGQSVVIECQSEGRTRCRVISIRPSSHTANALVRARSRPRCVRSSWSTLSRLDLRLHVDEVADDDAADVAQPDLARDLARGLEVRPEDRLLRDPSCRCSGPSSRRC